MNKENETVKTNIGDMPLEDYYEYLAACVGFDSYEDYVTYMSEEYF